MRILIITPFRNKEIRKKILSVPTVFVPSETINAARIEPVSRPALLTKF